MSSATEESDHQEKKKKEKQNSQGNEKSHIIPSLLIM